MLISLSSWLISAVGYDTWMTSPPVKYGLIFCRSGDIICQGRLHAFRPTELGVLLAIAIAMLVRLRSPPRKGRIVAIIKAVPRRERSTQFFHPRRRPVGHKTRCFGRFLLMRAPPIGDL